MATVAGLFRNESDAEQAINALKTAGYEASEIGVVAQNRDTSKAMAADNDVTDAGTVAGAGAVEGTVVGGALAALIATGTILTLPILGPIALAGSALAWTAAGAGIGAATGAIAGGLLGSLTDSGVPEDEARFYQTEVGQGGILLTVNSNKNESQTRQILSTAGAVSFQGDSGSSMGTGSMSSTYADSTSSTMDNAGYTAGSAMGSAGYAAGSALDNTGNAIGTAASNTGNALGNAASATGNAVGNVAHDTGKVLPDHDQVGGAAQETFGNVKRGVGDVFNNDNLQASGTSDVVEGKMKRAEGDVRNELGDHS